MYLRERREVIMQRDDFATFFAAVNEGATPFRWQERLLDFVLEKGRWPERIGAPTGAGKTSAIDVHVFASALSLDSEPRLPRRLVMVVDRRVLVDDQYERASRLARKLADSGDDVVAEVAAKLATMRGAERSADESPLLIGRMRGGAMPSRAWANSPSACAVLCATPDMWGSRLLFRGYGTSSLAAPREAGLLAFDSVVMVDEAHLARQLMVTARQVARLAEVAEPPIAGVPPLQVVEVTATPVPGDEYSSVTVDRDDLDDDLLADRLTRPKPVTLLPVRGWPGAKPGKIAAEMADAVTVMLAQVEDHEDAARTIGCFVNTVPMAVAVADKLRSQTGGAGKPLRVAMVCGQVRAADLTRLESENQGIFTPRGSATVDVIVATQSLEVGVDLDLAGIVSELAAGSALAQRAGRANRRGKRQRAPVTILVPAEPITSKTRSGPYAAEELVGALTWVTARAADTAGFAPWAVRGDPPPPAAPHRLLNQRPELADAWHWARTSDDLAAEPDLELWLADSLDEETSVGLVVRDALPADPADATKLVCDLAPAPWEVFPVPYRAAQTILTELLKTVAEDNDQSHLRADRSDENEQRPGAVRVRGDEITPLLIRTSVDGKEAADMRPGDIVVIDSMEAVFTPQPGEGFSPPVAVAGQGIDSDSPGLAYRGTASDVLHLPSQLRVGDLVFRLEARDDHRPVAGVTAADAVLSQLTDLAELAERGELRKREHRDQLRRVIAELIKAGGLSQALVPLAEEVRALLSKRVSLSDVTVDRFTDLVRVCVTDRRRAVADEDLRQAYSQAQGEVTLDAHQSAVATRARMLAGQIGLPPDLAAALGLAGAHHDDGKADLRFQTIRLGARDRPQLLAKSLPGTTARQVLQMEADAGLPSGWRHEQRSVAVCSELVHAQSEADPLLVLRLVGTSHGRGRSGFPHTSKQLKQPGEDGPWLERAAVLFDEGGWDELIEATQVRYGVWGCAYLEAILRAADCQVSGEGG
jgi:CRISPR-associated endonuclease/helicase Cas3